MAINIKKGSEMMQIPVIPLVDTVFNLLIFFLVATKVAEAERELPMPLPEASEAQPITAKPHELIINIDAQGRYFLTDRMVTLADLDKVLRRAYANNPMRPGSVVIRADKRCQWESVVAAMNSCRKAKVRDYRVTTREVPQATG
jgi:biopolymer transport protein ExbD